jgi:hypothetical protein
MYKKIKSAVANRRWLFILFLFFILTGSAYSQTALPEKAKFKTIEYKTTDYIATGYVYKHY